jgi:hypothetical protein
MGKHLFNVSVSSLQEIHDMPGSWCNEDYRQLLASLEIDDLGEVSPQDLPDITLMALQDLEPEAAADAVLAYKLQNKITKGARQNIVQDFLENQRPWEDVADIRLHRRLFESAVILRKSLPSIFSRPDMMSAILYIRVTGTEGMKFLGNPPEAAFVTRMLADAFSENSILERLFTDQLQSRHFPEAEGIIWHAEFDEQLLAEKTSANLTIYSSRHWLNELKSVANFHSNAYRDDPLEKAH